MHILTGTAYSLDRVNTIKKINLVNVAVRVIKLLDTKDNRSVTYTTTQGVG